MENNINNISITNEATTASSAVIAPALTTDETATAPVLTSIAASASQPSTAVAPPNHTIQIVDNDTIAPLKELSHKELKRLKADIERRTLNGRTVDRRALIHNHRTNIETLLTVYRKYDDDVDGNWETWNDEKFFQWLFYIFPENNLQSNRTSGNIMDLLTSAFEGLSFKNVSNLNTADFVVYTNSFNHIITNVVDVSKLTEEQLKAAIKFVMDGLPNKCTNSKDLKMMQFFRSEISKNPPNTLKAFLIALGELFHEAQNAQALTARFSLTPAEKNSNSGNNNGNNNNNGRIQKRPKYDHSSDRNNTSAPADKRHKKEECKGCGRNHPTNTCLLTSHPEFNSNHSISWIESPKGKEWNSRTDKEGKPYTVLPMGIDLAGNIIPRPPQLTRNQSNHKSGSFKSSSHRKN